jgi:hypothetical protein
MPDHKQASSQAAFAVLSEGVHAARVEAHRIRHLINRALRLVEESKHKEDIYQVGGDIIMGMPSRLDQIEQKLDKVSYALSIMGKDFLEARLPLSEKRDVEDGVKFGQPPFGGGGGKKSTIEKVAERWKAGHGS